MNTSPMLQILLLTIQKSKFFSITDWNVDCKDDLKCVYNSLNYYYYQFVNISSTDSFYANGISNVTVLVLSLHVIKHFEQGILVSNGFITLPTKLLSM